MITSKPIRQSHSVFRTDARIVSGVSLYPRARLIRPYRHSSMGLDVATRPMPFRITKGIRRFFMMLIGSLATRN